MTLTHIDLFAGVGGFALGFERAGWPKCDHNYSEQEGGMITFGSLFTGIGGFDLGFERTGMQIRWQCEIDEKASSVLAKHWPDIERYKDVRAIGKHNLEPVDLICGGFPCQDLSVAGKRAGLAGNRSGLWFEFHRILSELRPRWVVVENVPGLLSSNGGRDFAVILHGLGELGYLSAWRILDAQYFGVPQRRRRVFIVASLGNGRCAEVLFEREGGCRDTPPSREAGQGFASVAGTLAASGGGMERPAGNCNELDFCIPIAGTLDGKCCAANRGSQANELEFIVPAATPYRMTAFGEYADDDSGSTVKARDYKDATDLVAYISATLRAQDRGHPPLVGVRRLTPVECEKLQGFPPGWTAFTADGKPQSDSARYRQMGNAVCVAVAEWLGRRISYAQFAGQKGRNGE